MHDHRSGFYNSIMGRREQILEWFHWLHQNPESSWKEMRTSRFCQKIMADLGCRIRCFEGIPGFVAELGSGHPIVGLRADLDAVTQNVEGVMRANHSCGHDAHMAMVMGSCLALLEHELKGTVRFIFQPAEEKGLGALRCMQQGAVDDLTYLFGVHLRPQSEMASGFAAPAILHGAGGFYEGCIEGCDAHGARPHLGVNAIEVGFALGQQFQHIHLDPMVPHSIKMTRFLAGGDSLNVIPGCAQFGVDVRCQTNAGLDHIDRKLSAMVTGVAAAYGTGISLQRVGHVAASNVHPQAQNLMGDAIRAVLGADRLKAPVMTPGGDDFHFFSLQKPHLKATMLALGCGLTPGLHHPQMTFDLAALPRGAAILAEAVFQALACVYC